MERDIHLFSVMALLLEVKLAEGPRTTLRDLGMFCSEKCFWKRAILSRTEVKGKSYSTPGLSILDSDSVVVTSWDLLMMTLSSSEEGIEEESEDSSVSVTDPSLESGRTSGVTTLVTTSFIGISSLECLTSSCLNDDAGDAGTLLVLLDSVLMLLTEDSLRKTPESFKRCLLLVCRWLVDEGLILTLVLTSFSVNDGGDDVAWITASGLTVIPESWLKLRSIFTAWTQSVVWQSDFFTMSGFSSMMSCWFSASSWFADWSLAWGAIMRYRSS